MTRCALLLFLVLPPAALLAQPAIEPVAPPGSYSVPPATEATAPHSATPARAALEVTQHNGRYWWHDGSQWWYTDAAPREGWTYGGRFVSRGGKMQPVAQQGGYWATQCQGGVCRRVWIPQ